MQTQWNKPQAYELWLHHEIRTNLFRLSCQFYSGITVFRFDSFESVLWIILLGKLEAYASRSRLISRCFASLCFSFLRWWASSSSPSRKPDCASRREILIWNFQGCITVYLSRYETRQGFQKMMRCKLACVSISFMEGLSCASMHRTNSVWPMALLLSQRQLT